MTTADIVSEVSNGDLATGTININFRLRRVVIPTFLADVDRRCGRPWWRTGFLTLNVVANTREYALTNDFRRMDKLSVYDADDPAIGGYNEIVYRGEFAHDMLLAELGGADDDGDNHLPLGFYILMRDGAGGGSAPYPPLLYFTRTPTINFTAKGKYEKRVYFADNTTSVDLNLYIPEEWQVGIVHLLEYTLFKARYGAGDKRSGDARKDYDSFLESMVTAKHPAQQRRVVTL